MSPWPLSWPSPGQSMAVAAATGLAGGNEHLADELSCAGYLTGHSLLENHGDSINYVGIFKNYYHSLCCKKNSFPSGGSESHHLIPSSVH